MQNGGFKYEEIALLRLQSARGDLNEWNKAWDHMEIAGIDPKA